MTTDIVNDRCGECGKWTAEGEAAWRARVKPIFGTDLSRPISVILEGFRDDLTRVRGQLSDLGFAFPGWDERLECVEGLLTCGLISLAYVADEARAVETQRAQQEHERKTNVAVQEMIAWAEKN